METREIGVRIYEGLSFARFSIRLVQSVTAVYWSDQYESSGNYLHSFDQARKASRYYASMSVSIAFRPV